MLLSPPLPRIFTRGGYEIPAQEGHRLQRAAIVGPAQQILGQFSDRRRLRERRGPDGGYNCHGLTFLGRRAWLEDPEAVQRILTDDGYEEIRDLGGVLAGDIVVYYAVGTDEIEHTGIVVWTRQAGSRIVPVVLSKWRDMGEYIHDFDYCRYNAAGARFMREGHDPGFDERNRGRLRL